MSRFALNHMAVARMSFVQLLDRAPDLGCYGIEVRKDLPQPLFDGQSAKAAGAAICAKGLWLMAVAKVKRFNDWSETKAQEAVALMEIARPAAFSSKLVIIDEPTAALGVQETEQVENIIRTPKVAGEPLILISHNLRQVFDLVACIVVFGRGRIVTNLNKGDTDGQDVVAYITGPKTGGEFEGAA